MKIIVLGALGMLGRAMMKELEAGHQATGYDLRDFNLCEDAPLCGVLDHDRPDAVVNCAAYTQVDKAEDEPAAAMEINGAVPGRLARRCKERGVRLVHLGTDYVFDGAKRTPYLEDDPTGPIGVYGRSKLLGEELVNKEHPEGSLIYRTSWLFGDTGRSFPRTMLDLYREGRREFRVVNDQRGRPTYAPDLARLIRLGLEKGLTGLYHACNKGETTWFDLAVWLFARAGRSDVTVRPVPTSEYKTRAARPLYSALDTGKLERALGREMPPWPDGLDRFIAAWRRGREA